MNKELFKLIKIYHKPYRIFNESYVINIGNFTAVKTDNDIKQWLQCHMHKCIDCNKTPFNIMNSEWPIIDTYINQCNENELDSYYSFQHYSKILDLNSIKDIPYHDFTQDEDKNGKKYKLCKSLDEFGYGKIDDFLNKYDVIVGNQYPCNIIASIRSNLNIDYKQVLTEFINILDNYNDEIFTTKHFIDYCKLKYQYWRGGPIIDTLKQIKKISNFTIKFEHSFLDSKSFANQHIYKNKDGRGNGYLGEMVFGFAIYCMIEEYKRQNKKIGYCRMYTDADVIFGNTQR